MLPSLMPVVLGAFADADEAVRAAAGFCVGQFAEHLIPDVLAYHQQMMQVLLEQLPATKEGKVQDRIIYALQVYVENMDEQEVLPYLAPTCEQLVLLLMSAQGAKARIGCVTALSSAAVVAKRQFAPFAPKVLGLLKTAMEQTADQHLELRAVATECAGSVARAIGQDFGPYLETFCQLVLAGQELDFAELQEASFHFFMHLAAAMEAGFAPLLPDVVKLCIDAVEEDVLVPVEVSADPLDGMDSDEDAEDLARARELAIPAGALERQIAAAGCLREMAVSCPAAFLPHLG